MKEKCTDVYKKEITLMDITPRCLLSSSQEPSKCLLYVYYAPTREVSSQQFEIELNIELGPILTMFIPTLKT